MYGGSLFMHLLLQGQYNPLLTKWLRQVVLSPACVDLTALMGINLCGYSKMTPTTVENQGFTKIDK